jgi:hypothetical protein
VRLYPPDGQRSNRSIGKGDPEPGLCFINRQRLGIIVDLEIALYTVDTHDPANQDEVVSVMAAIR